MSVTTSVLSKEQRAKVIYISGAITGMPNNNFDNFNRVADKLAEDGWEVHNPADTGVVEGASWEDYMAYCLTKVGLCGAMYMLKGWQMSRGACLEQLIATALNFNIIYEESV